MSRSSPLTKLATVERFRELRELHQEALLDFVVRTTKHYERPELWLRWPNYSDRSRKGVAVRAVVSVPPQHGKSQLLLHHPVRFATTQPQKQSTYMGYGIEFARDQAPQAAIIEREATPRAPETDDQHLGYQQRGYPLDRDRRTTDRAEGRRHPDRGRLPTRVDSRPNPRFTGDG
ncbi:MAG: hypothetical protein OXH85_09935 [Truepera sp.]|nr:hypothetical protein [Truepera sp.]